MPDFRNGLMPEEVCNNDSRFELIAFKIESGRVYVYESSNPDEERELTAAETLAMCQRLEADHKAVLIAQCDDLKDELEAVKIILADAERDLAHQRRMTEAAVEYMTHGTNGFEHGMCGLCPLGPNTDCRAITATDCKRLVHDYLDAKAKEGAK
jgi:hypothetical protein